MKKFTLTVILAVGIFGFGFSQMTSISGTVTYSNSANTPMNNCTVSLLQNGVEVYQSTTDAGGNFLFNLVEYGSYELKVSTTKPAGGFASSDALAILRHYVGMQYLSGMNLAVADVNSDNTINSIDGLFISRCFVGQIVTFPAGKWFFEVFQLNVTGPGIHQDVRARCFGDVNGSFIPY